MALGKCLLWGGAGYSIKVTKGIHQPDYDPHIQISLSGDFDGDRGYHNQPYIFHLNVCAGRSIQATDSPDYDMYFYWEGVQFSVGVSYNSTQHAAFWPLISNRVIKRERRKSVIYSEVLEAQINKQNEEIAIAKKQEELEELARKKAEQEKLEQKKKELDKKNADKLEAYKKSGGDKKDQIKKILISMSVEGNHTQLAEQIYKGGVKPITFKTQNFNFIGRSSSFTDSESKIIFAGKKTKIKGGQVTEFELNF